jgi:hypothetical protein
MFVKQRGASAYTSQDFWTTADRKTRLLSGISGQKGNVWSSTRYCWAIFSGHRSFPRLSVSLGCTEYLPFNVGAGFKPQAAPEPSPPSSASAPELPAAFEAASDPPSVNTPIRPCMITGIRPNGNRSVRGRPTICDECLHESQLKPTLMNTKEKKKTTTTLIEDRGWSARAEKPTFSLSAFFGDHAWPDRRCSPRTHRFL